MMTLERRYSPNGRTAHLIDEADVGKPMQQTLCGRIESDAWWYGTGSQDEYDRAASLPTCKRCEAQS